MAQSTARPEAAVDLQMVREFLERYFTIENELNDHQLKAGGFKSFRRT